MTKEAFKHALETEKHVIMCPGGQAELIYASESWEAKPVVKLCIKHKGFIKLSIEHGASIVPVLNLGEILHFTNLGHWPWMQSLTYKRIGTAPTATLTQFVSFHSLVVMDGNAYCNQVRRARHVRKGNDDFEINMFSVVNHLVCGVEMHQCISPVNAEFTNMCSFSSVVLILELCLS